jgi:hypothetical protein
MNTSALPPQLVVAAPGRGGCADKPAGVFPRTSYGSEVVEVGNRRKNRIKSLPHETE